MGSRLTVSRMLTKRLAEEKRALNHAHECNELIRIFDGYLYSDQEIHNLQTDIEQLEYLIECLKQFKEKKDGKDN